MNRRWNLLDTMICVVTVAIGLALARWWYRQPGYVDPSAVGVHSASDMAAWLLLPMAAALIAIRLRKPRPRWRRLVRQPGLQASLLIGMAVVPGLLNGKWGYKPHALGFLLDLGFMQVSIVGPMVAAGWILTALARGRRPEPSMIDRSGRVLGWAWIVLWLVQCFLGEASFVRMWLASNPPVVSIEF